MYNKTHYNIVISLQLINVNGGKKKKKGRQSRDLEENRENCTSKPINS